jgi:hypothetical protein
MTPHLEELDSLIGMEALKRSLFYQLVYFIQGMHKRGGEQYLHTMIFAGPGSGKCLAGNTPVMMANGTIRQAKEVQEGDLLMGDDHSHRTVLSVTSGSESMYRVTQSYGDNYVVNESHVLSLKLVEGPRIHTRRNSAHCVSWFDPEGRKTKVFPFSEEPGERQAAMEDAKEFADRLPPRHSVVDIPVREYLKRSDKWKEAHKGYKTSVSFPVGSPLENAYFEGSSMAKGIGSPVLRIPHHIKTSAYDDRISFLAGFIDQAGKLRRDNKMQISPCRKGLAQDVVFIARSLAFHATMRRSWSKEGDETYCVVITGPLHIIPFVHQDVQEDEWDESLLEYSICVERIGLGRYYGFCIDGNRRFLLGDFTVTHNTTVAKIIGKLYRAMGILSRDGEFRVAKRDDFVAGYLGQTARQTTRILESCIGGVLFIDEVYALGPGQEDKDSFSKEAIDTINAFLSEHPSDFCCIAAGYEKEVRKCFFAVNPGLESRFPWVYRIPQYKADQLVQIFTSMALEDRWKIGYSEGTATKMIQENSNLFQSAGRDVRHFLNKSKLAHAQRVLTLSSSAKFELTDADLRDGLELVREGKGEEDEDHVPIGMYI